MNTFVKRWTISYICCNVNSIKNNFLMLTKNCHHHPLQNKNHSIGFVMCRIIWMDDRKRTIKELTFNNKKKIIISNFFISWKVHWYQSWIQIRVLMRSTYKNVLTLLNVPTRPKFFRRQNKPYQEFIREKVWAIKKSYLIPKNFKILLLKQQVFCFD